MWKDPVRTTIMAITSVIHHGFVLEHYETFLLASLKYITIVVNYSQSMVLQNTKTYSSVLTRVWCMLSNFFNPRSHAVLEFGVHYSLFSFFA